MPIKLKPLAEQVVVVTGASSGIGLLTARTAAARGAKVVLVARDGDTLAAEVAAITAAGGTADHAVADVGDWEQVRAAAAHAAQRFGRIDTWINNAGVAIYAPLADTPHDEHERLFRTNYFGGVHGSQAALPHLREHGGAIVTVASIVADLPSPVMGAYAASKAAVKSYAETLRMELDQAGTPVSVSLVLPSGVDTPVAHHAAVHLDGKARIPPPPYDPQLVADAILRCAEQPVREITVGGVGRAQVLFYQHFKGLAEKLTPKAAATFIDPTGDQPQPPNLSAPAPNGQVRSGDQWHRSTSLYTTAALHPGWTAAAAVAALLGGVAVWRRSARTLKPL